MTEQQRLRSAGRSRGNPTARGATRATERQRRGLAIPPDEVVHPAPGSTRKPAVLAASTSLMAVGVVLALALAPGWDLIGLALVLLEVVGNKTMHELRHRERNRALDADGDHVVHELPAIQHLAQLELAQRGAEGQR